MHCDNPIVVIGAGLAGLSAAITLQDLGREVLVIEASNRVGGRVSTDVIDGFTLDHGFQLINANYPEIKRLKVMSELDFHSASRIVEISIDGKLISIGDPRRNISGIFNPELGSFREKAAMLRYLTSKPRFGRSVEDELLTAGAGNFYLQVLKPFLKGVFLTSPTNVDSGLGLGIIKSFISGNSGLPERGVGELPKALAKRVKRISLNTQVEAISDGAIQTAAGEIACAGVVIATDLTTAAQLLGQSSIQKLAGCTTWYHSSDEAPTSQSNLVLAADSSNPITNSIVVSNLVRSYAPAGKHLISTTSIDSTSESEIRRGLASLWGRETTQWDLIAKYEIPSALPIFHPGAQGAKSSKIRDGVYVAGDFRTSPSQNGALLSGRLAAHEIAI